MIPNMKKMADIKKGKLLTPTMKPLVMFNPCEKSHHDDGYYHHESEKGDKGEKGSGYEEKGSYGKGHHTKGHHIEAKGDEYGKKTNFFDEDHDEGFEEKYGDFHEEHGHKKGGSHKGGHHKSSHEKGLFKQKDTP